MKRFPKGETLTTTLIKNNTETYVTRNEDHSKYTMYEKDKESNYVKIKTSNDPKKLEKGFWD